jgi:hypothetical protein
MKRIRITRAVSRSVSIAAILGIAQSAQAIMQPSKNDYGDGRPPKVTRPTETSDAARCLNNLLSDFKRIEATVKIRGRTLTSPEIGRCRQFILTNFKGPEYGHVDVNGRIELFGQLVASVERHPELLKALAGKDLDSPETDYLGEVLKVIQSMVNGGK